MLIYKRGDLLSSEAQTLVNAVNCAGYMGKGIALKFKEKFPYMFETYQAQCRRGEVQPGILTLHKNYHQWVLNFPTKRHWKENSRLAYVEDGLIQLSQKYQEWGITSLAVPALGCGLGGLDWSIVRPLIEKHLGMLEINVEVYEPNSFETSENADPYQLGMFGTSQKMPKRKKRTKK